jgi:predicted CoA-binding protein
MSQAPHRVAVLGASDQPERTSHLLVQRLKSRGDQVFPLHPALDSIAGFKVYRKLSDLPEKADVLSVYLNAQRSSAMADELLASPIRRVIFNPGAENPELMQALSAQGKQVEAACSLVLLSQGLL